MGNWKAFWFEGNQWFGMVKGPEDLESLKAKYPDFAEAKQAAYHHISLAVESEVTGETPNFGFRLEHQGPMRLRDFFLENGMEGVL